MPKITGKEILKRELATLKEILQLMKQGLPATTPTGDQIYDINDSTTGPSKEDISEFPEGYYGISMEIPTTPAEQAQAMNTVSSLVFSEEDFVNARYWGESMDQFPGLDTDMLMKAAGKWPKHIQNEYAVKISGITLYSFQGSFAKGQNPSEKLENNDDTRYISSLKYAIVFFIDCPGKTQEPGEWFACPHRHIGSFISRHTSHIAPGHMGIPDFAVTGIKAAYSGKVPDNFEDEWIILPACTGTGCNGIDIPEGVRTDEPGVLLYEAIQETDQHQPLEEESTAISTILFQGWTPKGPVDRLCEKSELAVWTALIEPIVKLHYKGTIHYKGIDGPEKITPDDFGALWEQHLAPVIYSNIPLWLEYPQSMDQREVESRISEHKWEPDLFVSQVLWKIRAGMWPEVVEPFFNCLINIVAGKDLPTFLAYIAQGNMEGLELERQQAPVENISNKPLHEKKPTGQLTGALSSPDDLIKTITIRYENDSQITIQQKGKSKIPVPFKQLRFNGIGITWTNFLKALQDPPKHYWSYPLNQLKTWNERLINLISESFAIQFPSNYKLYERAKEAGPGYYRFKFRIEYSDTIQVDESSKETFRKKFLFEIEENRRNPDDSRMQEILEMAATGLIKKFFTEDEVRECLDEKSRFNPELEFKEDPETTPEIESEEDEIDFREN